MVLVDTSIWSLYLRRDSERLNPTEKVWRREFEKLIIAHAVAMIGPVRQELLTGIREQLHFDRLRHALQSYPDEVLESVDYEFAAESSNRCQTKGIAGNPIDFIICAASIRRDWEIFTSDKDFVRYENVLPIRLFHVPPA